MFQPGDRVFAKMKGFPFWPARVDPLPPHVELPKGKVPVFFYGTHQVSFLSPKNLVSFEDNKDAYGKRKVLIKAMIEIESDPEVLLLGKDPAAEAFWESLYPREYGRVERDTENVRGRVSRPNSPATKRSLKRKGSKAPCVHSAKRQKSSDQEDDLNSMSSRSDTVDATLLRETEVVVEKEGIRQETEDYLQADENVNKRTDRKRHYSAVECSDSVEDVKRVKEDELVAHFGVGEAVLPMKQSEKANESFGINHIVSQDEIAEEASAEVSPNAVGNIVKQNLVSDGREESYNVHDNVEGDVEEAQQLTSVAATGISPIREEECSDIGGIVQNSVTAEYQKLQKDMRGGKLNRFVVDLDAESEDEAKYFRKCSRGDDNEDLDDDKTGDDYYYHRCVQKPKGAHKQSVQSFGKGKEKETVRNTCGGMDNELADESEAIGEPGMHDSSSSEREYNSKSSRSGDDEESYECNLKDSGTLQNRGVEEDKVFLCKNYEGIDDEPVDVSKPFNERRPRSSIEGGTFSKSLESDDFGESNAHNVKSGDVYHKRVMEEDRNCVHRNWGSGDEKGARRTKSLDLRRKGDAEGNCASRSLVSGGEVQKKGGGHDEGCERVRGNSESGGSEFLDKYKNIRGQRRPHNEGKDESNRWCSLKNSPRHKTKVSDHAAGLSRSKRRDSNDEVELVKHVNPSSRSSAPSGVDKLQILHDLTVQLKSSLVRGHEKFGPAVDVLERICATKVSLLQLTKVWELTDCVKKCRKYRLSAEVRDAASRALAYFQRVQAAASKEEVLKAKAIVAERMRREKSGKPSPTSAAAASVATSAGNTESPPATSSPEQQQEKKFSLEELRAELDAKADLLLARLAATEARLMAERNKTTSSPMAPSSSSAVASAVSSSRRRTEETAKDVLSRVDEVASRLGVDSCTVPPPPPPPPPPRFARPQQVDLDTRISQLMMGVITPPSRPPPHPQPQLSSPPQSPASAKLLALREQIQRKRRSAATAAASTAEPHREATTTLIINNKIDFCQSTGSVCLVPILLPGSCTLLPRCQYCPPL
ncbi:hypothetical protein TcWFU_010244 [Taenia crassiceps]|uniref:PWWP domain-containing protein n=1 Tax=Taenia crassiceps TaxID=6207 RepID=A0ABR4Q3L1_9CEST